uniref:tryptophan synthase subunit alpha n=1 Tax=Acetatifactor sp. TaxID=1872090 RepID=UPI004055E144
MTNSISKVFENKNSKALIGFLTAGDPGADCTVKFVLEMERAGVDLVELGIPFSDPTAEGTVIQEANIRALSAGMTTDGVFDIVARIRETSQIPITLVTYANLVFHYGYERFFAKCEEMGVCAVKIQDIPYEEKQEVIVPAKAHNVTVISYVATFAKDRLQMIAKDAKGYLYMMTPIERENEDEMDKAFSAILNDIREVTDIPCVAVCDVCTPEEAQRMAKLADGIIVDSALVGIVAEYGENAADYLFDCVKCMKDVI